MGSVDHYIILCYKNGVNEKPDIIGPIYDKNEGLDLISTLHECQIILAEAIDKEGNSQFYLMKREN